MQGHCKTIGYCESLLIFGNTLKNDDMLAITLILRPLAQLRKAFSVAMADGFGYRLHGCVDAGARRYRQSSDESGCWMP
jgi:hypothetical protein